MDMQNVSNLQIPEGAVRTIHDKDNRLIWGRLSYDTKYVGDTVQDGTPTPDAPIPVQTVAGEQTVTVNDGVDSEAFPISLGSIELCKIGDYQDYIYKSGDDWYVHKATGKVNLSNITNWTVQQTTLKRPTNQSQDIPNIRYPSNNSKVGAGLAEKYIMQQATGISGAPVGYMALTSNYYFFVNVGAGGPDPTGLFYYALATPTNTQITDATLIGQLNAVYEWLTRYGYNATVSGNLPLIVDRTNL